MRFYVDDKTGERLTENETTVLRVRGPLELMTNKKELHLSKQTAKELAEFLGLLSPAWIADPLDQADATAKDLQSALRVQSLSNGSEANSTPPKPATKRPRKPA